MAGKRKPRKKTAKKKSDAVIARGKRKTSVARATVKKGSGKVRVNSKLVDGLNNSYVRGIIMEPLGYVGPEAITSGLFPITSEIASVMSRSLSNNSANLPPFTTETCFLRVLISSIVALHDKSCCVIMTLSSIVIPSTGYARSELPPPERRTTTVDLGDLPFKNL